MKRILPLSIVVILAGAFSLSSLKAQDNRGDRVCVYEHSRYEGWSQCFGPGEEIADLKSRNNKISSIRVFGRANASLFADTNYRGYELRVSNDIADLNTYVVQQPIGNFPANWNDKVESLRVGGDRDGDRDRDRDRNTSNRNPREREPRDGICVYDRTNFQGRSQCWESGDNLADLTRSGADWSDRISSIRVFGRAAADLYSDTRFRGERLSVDRNIPDLAQFRLSSNNNGRGRGEARGRGNANGNGRGNRSWNDQVSSLRVLSVRRSADNRR
jgi:hypothetical protein